MRQPAVHIMVVRQDRLGDAIIATAALQYLRETQPEAQIHYMVQPQFVGLFAGQPYLDSSVAYTGRIPGLVGTMRRLEIDRLIMLHPAKALAWAALFAGVKRKTGLGFRPYYPLTGFRPTTSSGRMGKSERAINLMVTKTLFPGIDADLLPVLAIPARLKREARQFLADKELARPWVVFPANRGSAPNWEPARYRELVMEIEHSGNTILLAGAPGEEQILREVKGTSKAFILAPQTDLLWLAALLHCSRIAIASSTGGLHIAAAVGTPTVAIHCPLPARHPDRWGPRGTTNVNLVSHSEACRQCNGDIGCRFRDITIQDVLHEASRIVDG